MIGNMWATTNDKLHGSNSESVCVCLWRKVREGGLKFNLKLKSDCPHPGPS